VTLTDVGFVSALQRGELFADADARDRWNAKRPAYDALQDDVFTLRHLLRSSEIDPWRMLASAFLHGGPGHLFGNMVFLAALGLLVEGALGAGRFVGLYLLGALGSSAVSLAWRWGEAGGGLGASGAIAAQMGAFCVVWGRQPVRFFYWFGVVFDYTRKPAILLLPAWLGWEIYNLFAHSELNIGFDAHAGGLLSGALLGALLVAAKQVREDFIREDPAAQDDARWQLAQQHLGKLRLAEADVLLEQLQREAPQRFDVALARWRVARNGSLRARRHEQGVRLLQTRAPDAVGARTQADVAAELRADGAPPQAEVRDGLLARWLALGCVEEVAAELQREAAAADAAHWFALGLAYRERADEPAFRHALQQLLSRWPGAPIAAKARFLLDNR
jgi:membrane associated rhomboid family serine protease